MYMVVSILICCRTRTPRNLMYKTWYIYLLSIATSVQPALHNPVWVRNPHQYRIAAHPFCEIQSRGERFVSGDSRFSCPPMPSHDCQMLG